jgi:DUF4097 and DUF4098 domain-containing protein YvlB
MRHALATAFTILVLASPAAAQQRSADDFTWQGRVPAGEWLQIRNINGEITVDRATGDQVEVVATKRWKKGNPADVRIETSRFGTGDQSALVCAIWGTSTSCDERGYHNEPRRWNNDNDVSVDFNVKLPAGVRAELTSVNGTIRVVGASAEIIAETVNGAIDASTSIGPVKAETVNGDITVRMDAIRGSDDLDFETVNGDVTAILPASFQGEVELETVNGSLHTDFPITVQGRFDPRHMRATIGSGGRRLKLTTVNGDVRLGKRQ